MLIVFFFPSSLSIQIRSFQSQIEAVWLNTDEWNVLFSNIFTKEVLNGKKALSYTVFWIRHYGKRLSTLFYLIYWGRFLENGSDQLVVYRGIDGHCIKCQNQLIRTILETVGTSVQILSFKSWGVRFAAHLGSRGWPTPAIVIHDKYCYLLAVFRIRFILMHPADPLPG